MSPKSLGRAWWTWTVQLQLSSMVTFTAVLQGVASMQAYRQLMQLGLQRGENVVRFKQEQVQKTETQRQYPLFLFLVQILVWQVEWEKP